jgi:hypothetical protein
MGGWAGVIRLMERAGGVKQVVDGILGSIKQVEVGVERGGGVVGLRGRGGGQAGR